MHYTVFIFQVYYPFSFFLSLFYFNFSIIYFIFSFFHSCSFICFFVERSLEVKLLTIWTDGKAEVGRIREKKQREDQRGERARRKTMQAREKVEKPGKILFFQWFLVPEGPKEGSLKRRVREPSSGVRDENLRVVVAWRTKGTACPEHGWKLRFSKSAHSCRPFLEVEIPSPLLEASFEVKKSKSFWTFRCRFAGRRKGFCTLSKVSKTRGVCAVSKALAGVGH